MTTETRVLKIGIAARERIQARTMAIARGEYKPRPEEPKVWFTSIESLAQVLSTKNKLLLELIAQSKPISMKELASLSGRQVSNLSRTISTMQRYGLVSVRHDGMKRVPEVSYDRIELDMSLEKNVDLQGFYTNDNCINQKRRPELVG